MSRDLNQQQYQDLVVQFDALIKGGSMGQVVQQLGKLNLASVPRESRGALAKICRRVGAISLGLRLLQPIIREEKAGFEPATSVERCEYAVLLSRNGSNQEARGLLEKVDSREVPDALLYLAYCHITDWDYKKAIPLLQQFTFSNADPYSKLIAKVNLISACLAENRLDDAEALLAETIAGARQSEAARLLANCLELQGQLFFQKRDFATARSHLEQATGIFGASRSYDSLFILKWTSLMEAFETHSTRPIIEFRKKAVKSQQWQNVREADLYTMKLEPRQELLDYLSFGTPMRSYRQRILQELGPSSGQSFLFGSQEGPCLDLATGMLDGRQALSPGKKIQQMLAVLLKDFYIPRNMGTLFSDLYPEEYFDINSSPLKIRQLLKQTRQWLITENLAASIVHQEGSYRLQIDGLFRVRLVQEIPALTSENVHILRLRSCFEPGVTFSAKQACERLQWPRSSFLAVAETALQSGELMRTGNGKAILYALKAVA